MARYIFITGGVVSSLGKGLMAASLAALLQARGYRVRIRKFDPYLNVDPGTMSPHQHGEVYVTDDGAETDLDLGHYERFTGVASRQSDNITSGRIYKTIIERERRGDYLGAVVGHIDLTMLVGRHRAGIDVEIGIELADADPIATRLEQSREARCHETLAQRGDHAAGDEDIPRHGRKRLT